MRQVRAVPVIMPVFEGIPPQAKHPADLRQMRVDEFLSARSLAPKTLKAYRFDLGVFLQWTTTAWESVTPRQVATFKTYLLRIEEGKRVYSDASVVRILGTLKNFLRWMADTRYITVNPTIGVALPKLAEPEARNLSERDVNRILNAIEETSLPERNLALIALLAHGLRPSEPCGLDVADYDGEFVKIRQAKADSKGRVPLDEWAIAALNAYLGWRVIQGEEIASKTPLIVSHSNRNQGQRITYDTVRKMVYQLNELAGFEFHAHQLRHTFATNLILEGVNPFHVQTLTRHKSAAAFRRYTKAADFAAASAAFKNRKKS